MTDDDLSDLIAARRRPRRAATGTEHAISKNQYENMLANLDARIASLRAKKQEVARGEPLTRSCALDEYWRLEGEIVAAELDWFRLAEFCAPVTDKHKAESARAEAMRTAKKARAAEREAAISAAIQAEHASSGRTLKVILGAVNDRLIPANYEPIKMTAFHNRLKLCLPALKK